MKVRIRIINGSTLELYDETADTPFFTASGLWTRSELVSRVLRHWGYTTAPITCRKPGTAKFRVGSKDFVIREEAQGVDLQLSVIREVILLAREIAEEVNGGVKVEEEVV